MRYDLSFGTYGTGNGQFHSPGGIGANSTGTAIYVVDDLLNNCQEFDAAGIWVRTFGGPVSGFSGLADPFDVSVHPSNGDVYVADHGHNRIAQFQADGTYIRTWGTAGSGNGQFLDCTHVRVARSGTVYVGDEGREDIQTFTASGAFVSVWMTGLNPFQFDIALIDDTVWVAGTLADTNHYTAGAVLIGNIGQTSLRFRVGDTSGYYLFVNGVRPDFADANQSAVLTQENSLITTFGSTGIGTGQFLNAINMVVRGQKIWICDQNNFRVQQWSLVDQIPTSPPRPPMGRGAGW